MIEHISISVNGICKTYKKGSRYETRAVDNVSFRLNSGEVTGLVGPNGAGKSTLMRIILGFLKADSGDISIFGKSPKSIEAKSKIGYQADSQFRARNYTVGEYLELHSELAGFGKNTAQINELLDNFNMRGALRKPLFALSKGMRQKIELIQAFLGKPNLIMLDEPTAALDPMSVIELREFINRSKSPELTVLFSSHHLAEVEKVCDRVLFIHLGLLHGDYYMNSVEQGFLEQQFVKIIEDRRAQ